MSEEFTIPHLIFLRRVTRAVSDYLHAQLKEQLNTIAPLLRPRRMFGDYIESGVSEPVVDAEKNFAVLAELYSRAAGKPFELPRPLRPPLKAVSLALEIYPWEYAYTVESGEPRVIKVTSPVRWVISYSSGVSLSRLREGLAGKEDQKMEDVREFVIRGCMMRAMLEKYTGIAGLLRSLRWEIQEETAPDLGELPLMTLTAPICTTLPPDELILESTEMSGMPMFEEVVDIEAVSRMSDPLADRVQGIIESAKSGRERS